MSCLLADQSIDCCGITPRWEFVPTANRISVVKLLKWEFVSTAMEFLPTAMEFPSTDMRLSVGIKGLVVDTKSLFVDTKSLLKTKGPVVDTKGLAAAGGHSCLPSVCFLT